MMEMEQEMSCFIVCVILLRVFVSSLVYLLLSFMFYVL